MILNISFGYSVRRDKTFQSTIWTTPARIATMASSEIPEWAKSPSALETVLYYHGLGVALQARTVDPAWKQPEDCDIPYHEDLLAAWPSEDHDDLIELNHIKLGMIKHAKQAYLVDISDTRPSHWFLDAYQQKYLAFSEPEDTALIQK